MKSVIGRHVSVTLGEEIDVVMPRLFTGLDRLSIPGGATTRSKETSARPDQNLPLVVDGVAQLAEHCLFAEVTVARIARDDAVEETDDRLLGRDGNLGVEVVLEPAVRIQPVIDRRTAVMTSCVLPALGLVVLVVGPDRPLPPTVRVGHQAQLLHETLRRAVEGAIAAEPAHEIGTEDGVHDVDQTD